MEGSLPVLYVVDGLFTGRWMDPVNDVLLPSPATVNRQHSTELILDTS